MPITIIIPAEAIDLEVAATEDSYDRLAVLLSEVATRNNYVAASGATSIRKFSQALVDAAPKGALSFGAVNVRYTRSVAITNKLDAMTQKECDKFLAPYLADAVAKGSDVTLRTLWEFVCPPKATLPVRVAKSDRDAAKAFVDAQKAAFAKLSPAARKLALAELAKVK